MPFYILGLGRLGFTLLDHQPGYYYYIIRIRRPLTMLGWFYFTQSLKLQAIYMLFERVVNYKLCAIGQNTEHSMKQDKLMCEPRFVISVRANCQVIYTL